LRNWKFDPNYGEEEVILGDGDDEMSEVTGREWERQGEKDPDEELSDLIEKYLELMMAEENDDGDQDEEKMMEQRAGKSRVFLIQKKRTVKNMGKVKVAMVVMVQKTRCSVSGWEM
jgi:hypothetical protein